MSAPEATPTVCPTCRSAIPAESPGGACPRCLMAIAFATDPGANPPPDVAPDEVHRRFPGYEVLSTIGRGGMGIVFRARQKALDREVALKVLPGGPSRPAGFVERFAREAKALARLQHPGIVQVFDFGSSDDGWCFLAMELVEGTNLRGAIAARRISPKEALAIVPQICDALQYAHDHGVVHRDIKPDNVLLTTDGRVKVADFGLAKLLADPQGASFTRTGLSMGTPLYMAPEQVERPGDVDHRADIYSLGVVFYEMLTGELPIGRFAPPSSKSEVDARIDDIVLRTLEKEREARFQQASDVKTRIGEASVPAPAAPVAKPRTSRLAVAGALLVVPVALLVTIAARDAEMSVLLGVPAALAIAAMGVVAAVRIHRRRELLAGAVPAAIAISAGLVLVTVAVSQAFARRSQMARYVAYDSTFVPASRTGRSADWARALVEKALASHPVAPTASALGEFYDDEDVRALLALPEDALRVRGGAGHLGLPLVGADFFGCDLAQIEVDPAAAESARTLGTVLLRTPTAAFSARLRGGGPGEPWKFAASPIVRVPVSAVPAQPAPSADVWPSRGSPGEEEMLRRRLELAERAIDATGGESHPMSAASVRDRERARERLREIAGERADVRAEAARVREQIEATRRRIDDMRIRLQLTDAHPDVTIELASLLRMESRLREIESSLRSPAESAPAAPDGSAPR